MFMTDSRNAAVVIIALLFFSGCSSSWKAPVYSSSGSVDSRPAKVKSSYRAGSRYYKVQKGDTLYAIAWQTANDFENLVRWNRLKHPFVIYPGQSLLVKAPKKTATNKPKTQTTKKPLPHKTVTTSKPKPVTAKTPAAKYKSNLRWNWPVNGRVIGGFKSGDDTKKGVMLSGKIGDPVKAAESGKVVYSGSGLIGYGKLIIIKHNNKYLSAYGFNSKIFVKEGSWITKGEKIALLGQSDKGVPALHFEIRKNGSPVNPVALLPRR